MFQEATVQCGSAGSSGAGRGGSIHDAAAAIAETTAAAIAGAVRRFAREGAGALAGTSNIGSDGRGRNLVPGAGIEPARFMGGRF